MYDRDNDTENILGCIFTALAIPFILILSDNDKAKTIGWIMIIAVAVLIMIGAMTS